MTRDIAGHPFQSVGPIEPERTPEGRVLRFMPQSRYRNLRGLPLNKHGDGPFCRFSIARSVRSSGVYIVTLESKPAYAGKCADLSRRFGSQGYGAIQPKNCFTGGQSTNCKVNHLILEHAEQRLPLELWFHAIDETGALERHVITSLRSPWNGQVPW